METGQKMASRLSRVCAVALFQIPLQIRAFSSSSCTCLQEKNNLVLSGSACCSSRGLLVKKIVRGWRSASTQSSLILGGRHSPRNTRTQSQCHLSVMTSNDVYSDQQTWLDIRRSLQTLEPKYRYLLEVLSFPQF